MTKEDFLYLMGDDPLIQDDEAFVDSFIMKPTPPTPQVLTKSGNPLTIVTSGAQNAISTILSFSPKQSGTGDPSPDNVRPISGWTEVNLFGCGKNICDEVFESGAITTSSGVNYVNINTIRTKNYIPCNPQTTYYCKSPETLNIVFYGLDKTYLGSSTAQYITNTTMKTPINAYYMRFFLNGTSYGNNVSINYPSTATAYEPYTQGANNTISLGGTYYGFTVDVEGGVLRVTHAIVDLGSLSWNYNPATATTQRYYNALVSDCAIVDRYTVANAVCDIYKIDTWRHLYDLASDKSFAVSDGNTNHSIYIRDTDYDNAIDFTTAVNGHKIVYPLATPLELPITPQTVALLAGNNTIWCDGDSLSVTYTGYDLRRM